MNKRKFGKVVMFLLLITILIDSRNIVKADEIISISNNGFENNTTSWGVWNASGNLNVSIENNFSYSGSKSILMNNNLNKSARGTIAQVITNVESSIGKSITLTQWLKSENLQGDGIQLRVNFLDSNGKAIEKIKVYDLLMEGTKPWTKRDIKFYVPNNKNIKKIEIGYLYDNETGKLWIDEISGKVTEVKADPDIVKNSSFEDGITEWGTWNASGNLGVAIEKNLRYDGESSLFIYNKNKTNARGTVAQVFGNIENSIGKSINITQWIKSENFSGDGLQLRIRFLDKNEEQVGKLKVYDLDIVGSKPWTKRDIKFYVPDNNLISKIELAYLYDNASGNIWIDNIDGEIKEASEEKGIITNPSFEDGITEWGVWNANGNLAAYIDNNLRYDGSKSLLLYNRKASSGRGTIAQIIENADSMINKNLVLSQWIKSENLVGDGVKLRVRFLDGSENMIGNMKVYDMNVSSNSNWTKSETSIAVPNNQDINKIEVAYLYDNNTGNLWIDRVSAEVKNKTEADLENKISNNDLLILGNQGTTISGKLVIDDSISKITKVSTIESGKIEFDDKLNYIYVPSKDFNGYEKVIVEYLDINEVSKKLEIDVYVAPSIEVIKNSILKSHSRILVTNEKFEQIKNNIKTDENMKTWYSYIENEAKEVLSSSVVPYAIEDGLRLNVDSSDVIILMSFMYRITNDVKYADRAWAEINNVINYKEWNNNHLLDTATLSYGIGVGYDWLNSYLTTSQKDLIKATVKDKALNYAKELYEVNSPIFVSETLNWNIVNNAGFIISALSIFDNDDFSAEIIQEGFKSINNFLLTYYDGGDTIEGPGYWEYSTEYLIYLLESINTSMSIENKFVTAPGVDKTMEFLTSMTGNLGIYNYSDSYDNFVGGDLALWFAKQYNNPKFTQVSKVYKEKTNDFSIYDLIWYDANTYNSNNESDLDYIFNKTSVGSFRSSWNLNESNYLAFKGGENGTIHGDLDLGSFIYDSLGVRWAVDLGRDDYNIEGYWDYEGGRWNSYKKNAEGHNTIIVGNNVPTKQKINAEAKITSYDINTNNPYAIIDMKNVYGDSVINLTRKFELINNRSEAKITDNFELVNKEDITWQMHTLAEIVISEDGKAAVLKYGNKELKLKLDDNIGAKFEIVKLDNIQIEGEDVNKLIIKGNAKSGYISVTMSSGFSDNIIKNPSFESNLNSWGIIGSDKLSTNIDTANVVSGNKALKLVNNDVTNKGGLSQIIEENIEGIVGKVINVGQSIKVSNLSGKSFELRAKFFDENKNEIEGTKVYTLNTSKINEWIKENNKIVVPNNPNIKYIELQYLYNEAYGTLWIDSIEAKVEENTEANSIIKNYDFEDAVNYWGIWNANGNLLVSLDKNVYYSGSSSVKLSNNNSTGRGTISQTILNSENYINKTIEVSQYIKSKAIVGDGLKLRVNFNDSNGNQVESMKYYDININNKDEWTQEKVYVQVPNNSNISKIEIQYLYDNNVGEIWIDKITTNVSNKDEDLGILKNSGFEDSMNSWGIWNANGNLGVSVEQSKYYSGKQSIKMFNKSTSVGRGTIGNLIDNLNIESNKNINVKYKIKSEGLIGNGVQIRVKFYFEDGTEDMYYKLINIGSTQDWTEDEVNVSKNKTIKKLEVQYLYDNCVGSIWIDDVELNIK